MPNLCSYEIRVIGSKESRDKFADYMWANYIAGNRETEPKKYFSRIAIDYVDRQPYVSNYGEEGDCYTGDCAWSIKSCMFNGEHTYFGKGENPNLVCIENVTKDLGLRTEIWSEEPGMEFCEHYYIDNGNVIVEECLDLKEEEIDGEFEYTEKPDNFWEFEYL